jgi:hypothetical protein
VESTLEGRVANRDETIVDDWDDVGELAERSKSSCIANPKTPWDLLLLVVVLRLATTSKEEPSTVHGAGVEAVLVPVIVESGKDQSRAEEDRNM